MKRSLLIAFILACLARHAYTQGFDPQLSTRLQFTLDSMRIVNNIKGISACIIYPGMGTWKGVSGVSHAGSPVTSDMEFGIASNTKLFTGVLLLKLAEHGILHLDDSLHAYLPTMANIDSSITIRQLLNHTSGLADVTNVVGYADSILLNPNHVYSPSDVMTWVGAPLFAAGTGWDYCNTNYLLAGMIAESATGKSYGQLLHDSILGPLQLDSTFLDVYDSIVYPVAHPWQGGVDNNGIPRKSLNSASWAAGAMYSTAGEMAQWYQALMNGQVLNPVSMTEMTTFVGSGNYGIGLYETPVLGRIVWQHGGTIWGGYNSSMMYDTTTGIIISVLINQNPSQAFPIARQLLSAILNFPTGINEPAMETNPCAFYPNPASEQVNLSIPKQNIQQVMILDAAGQLWHETSDTEFSVRDLPPGVYFIRAKTTEGTCVSKFTRH